ncbi:DUF441 domain-containing protein [Alkalibacillus salilacus]|uniref:UPF0756 membrane protein J2S77_002195 n=1 Tax=Alkalibacillus salilacus TaxID=284582 RepID=A0ABT9VGV1_9BACI|nr:DUF441 domain-containing protein [Alkalibacillus salilacus]MDQ0160193.1 uncharacterized membrane protein (DUF441 family) [Alkalibacillus salilacus]
MFSSSTVFLLILLALGFIAKNQPILIAVYILLGVKLFNLEDRLLPFIESKGIFIGVVVITVAVLVPIATGEIGFSELYQSIKSYYAWIAIAAGAFVAYVARDGLDLMANEPHLTAALVLGTILGVVFLQGVAVGPLIGAGIAYLVMQGVDGVLKLIS